MTLNPTEQARLEVLEAKDVATTTPAEKAELKALQDKENK